MSPNCFLPMSETKIYSFQKEENSDEQAYRFPYTDSRFVNAGRVRAEHAAATTHAATSTTHAAASAHATTGTDATAAHRSAHADATACG